MLCSHHTAEYLTQFARHLVDSTAISPAQAAALAAACTRLRQAMIGATFAQQIVISDGLERNRAGRKIIAFIHRHPALYLRQQSGRADAAARLRDLGLYAPAIRPPTVPMGQARLRHHPHRRPQPRRYRAPGRRFAQCRL